MKAVYQTKFGEPEGNCFAACLASLLEINIDDVPDFSPQPDDKLLWFEKANIFLRTYGLVSMFFTPEFPIPKDTFYLINGMSPRGLDHSTIGKNGVIVHDPHPDGGGVNPITDLMMFFRTFDNA